MKYFIYLILFNVCLAQELGIVVSKSKLKKQPKGFSKSHSISVSVNDTVFILSDSTDKYYHVKIQDFIGWIKKDKVTKILKIESPKLVTEKVSNKKPVKKKFEEKKVNNETVREKKKREISKKVENKKVLPPKEKTSNQLIPLKQNTSLKEDESNGSLLYIIILILSTIGLAYLSIIFFLKYKKIEKRFKPVVDIDVELEKVNKD